MAAVVSCCRLMYGRMRHAFWSARRPIHDVTDASLPNRSFSIGAYSLAYNQLHQLRLLRCTSVASAGAIGADACTFTVCSWRAPWSGRLLLWVVGWSDRSFNVMGSTNVLVVGYQACH